jgi:hypothetical protein
MRTAAVLLSLALGAAQAADGTRNANHRPSVPDLDLNLDFDAAESAAPPAARAHASRAWVYWSAGAGALLAAGGAAWYWREIRTSRVSTVTREQVFTDER